MHQGAGVVSYLYMKGRTYSCHQNYMKKYLSSIAAASLIAGSMATVVPVNAQTTSTATGTGVQQQGHFRGHGGHGMFGKDMSGQRLQDMATLLGITTSDLQSRLQSGKTFQQILSDLGITQADFQQKMQAQLKTKLDAQVSSGKITQAQEDQMLQRMQNPPAKGPWGMGAPGKPGTLPTQMLQGQADLLGISVTDLQSRLAQGKTFQQIAQDLGITQAQMQAKRLDQMKTHLQSLVTSGKITQAQADSLLQKMQNRSANGWGMRHGLKRGLPRPQPATSSSSSN
jgi:uncharacterized protein (DUF433 family)